MRVVSDFDYCNKIWYKYLCPGFCVNISFHFFVINMQKCSCWVYGCCMFSFFFFLRKNTKLILHSHQQCVWVIQFLHILINIWYYNNFYYSYSDKCAVIAHCGFILISLMANNVRLLYLNLFATCIPFLVKYLLPMF